ncbi:kinesin-like protein KIF11 [Pristis pectinata]|uniref:kinesin-like protein KIF11 n=1 Tax=Pristis pectinata TaxID=685728 RepID=UPI00223E1D69|nr:kinesin-like protein KIF11 [Pristis pectinata]XP_051882853.1 kinesin-like protein KIF11 [Pristis pectinata]XP_051882854.1 kinesin-like protein KIF11 [Pristis pectinata]
MSSQISLSKKEEKAKNIQVVVRCRPLSLSERKSNATNVVDCDPIKREVAVRNSALGNEKSAKKYTFDMVFGPAAKQIDVYKSVVYPILDEVIMGYNCTIFAYGQTGTGKTFTMEGERSQNEQFTWEEDPLAGIIPRTLHQIFERLAAQGAEFSVKVSLLEIYNEELFDLLSPSTDVGERLQMFDDPRNKRGVIIKGLEEISVHNKDEVYQILERGAARRTTAATLMNAYSSRSHSVFSITIHMKETTLDGEELVKIGKLNLVDLAGSENIGRSGAVDKRAREAGNINQSLLTLGRVITALVERTPHVPYRESKLTRILQDSLGGRTKTSIIATISPASMNLEETMSTLDYAYRAKNILNKPEVNQKLTKRALIKEYTEEIERLKRDLAAAREKNGVYMSVENYEFMQSKVTVQEETINDYVEKIAAMEEELKRVNELFLDGKKELEQCMSELQQREQVLQETWQDLELTKGKLSEEEFVCDAHAHTEQKLYSTASELLQVVEVSTRDVSGLHAKLDRKTNVEFHNRKAQKAFLKHMNDLFTEMQTKTDETRVKQWGMLDFYAKSIGDLVGANASALSSAMSSMATAYSSMKNVISSEVSQGLQELLKQESMTEQSLDCLQKALADHKRETEKMFKKNLQPMVASILELNNCLKLNFETYSGMAEKMEVMKMETDAFFGQHSKRLNKLQESICSALDVIQNENGELRQELEKMQQEQMEGISNVISNLQSQLGMLVHQTQKSFDSLLTQNGNVQHSLTMLQEKVHFQSAEVMEGATSHQENLATSLAGFANEIRNASYEGIKTADQLNVNCQQLGSSMLVLCQESSQWCESTEGTVDMLRQDQVSSFDINKRQLRNVEQTVNENCDPLITKITEQLKEQCDAEESVLSTILAQVNDDKREVTQYLEELTVQAQAGLDGVFNFLKEELRQDIPTGTTPQRKDYPYPHVLSRTEPRDVLVAEYKLQQQELQSSLAAAMHLQEETIPEQDTVEDEQMSTSNDSFASEKMSTEDFCHSGGAPFFQHKKSHKKDKENKHTANSDQSKSMEDNSVLSVAKSKLPLRVHN